MKAVMYHYVRKENEQFPYFKFLHIEDFKNQLDFLTENYGILHPDVLKESILTGKRAKGVILTFDDGVKDHYKQVMPELLNRGLSGIFYISSGMYESKKILGVHQLHLLLGRFSSKRIYHYLKSAVTEEMLSHAHIKEFQTIPYSLQNNDEYTNMVKRMLNYLISYEYKDQILDSLMQEFFGNHIPTFESFYLSTEEIKKMHDAGMVIGNHSKTHPVLSKLSFQEQQDEILSSFDYLETICIKLPFKTFCYPYGGFYSFTKETEQILNSSGCLFSFNVETRDISEDDLVNRPQALPRYDCNYFPHGMLWENKRTLNEEK